MNLENGIPFSGDLIPGDNPCESCYCGARNEPECSSMACEACPTNMHHVSVPGSCCGECHDVRIQPVIGCAVNGNQYAVGLYFHYVNTPMKCVII